MGRAIDATGIQFKLLNRSRGPAVWSPRAQADKRAYGAWVRQALDASRGISMDRRQGRAGSLAEGDRVSGLATRGRSRLRLQRARRHDRHVPERPGARRSRAAAGRPSRRAAVARSRGVAQARSASGWGRLKTGTPPRLDRRSIDFSRFEEQRGDDPPIPFSFLTDAIDRAQIRCHVAAHDARACTTSCGGTSRSSPLYNGQISGIGPRYCPSLEDKIMRFPDRERHQIFLEPEGLDVDEIYVNGLSMSLPPDVQHAIVRALAGLEDAEMLRPGYAVEYDFIQPTELRRSLETKRVRRPLPGRPDQRHVRLRGGGGAGLIAGVKCRSRSCAVSRASCWPRRGVHRQSSSTI